jgi:hypothetical protein
MIKFNVTRKQSLTPYNINKAKEAFLLEVGELLFTELFVATSSSGPESLGIKTGRLRQSLRMNMTTDSVEVYFDPHVAAHAGYALQGTRFIKPRNILENSLQRVLEGNAYAQAKTKFMQSLGIQNASR